jgi:hypothetical protein
VIHLGGPILRFCHPIEAYKLVGQGHAGLDEVDRPTGRMTIYVDGQLAGETQAMLAADASLDNHSDLLPGKSPDDTESFRGDIDFVRVCQGTLVDAQATIEELYEWQTNDFFKYDFCGRKAVGPRDTGASEYVE